MWPDVNGLLAQIIGSHGAMEALHLQRLTGGNPQWDRMECLSLYIRIGWGWH